MRLTEEALAEYQADLDRAAETRDVGQVLRLRRKTADTAPGDPEVPLSAGETLLDLGYLNDAEAAFSAAIECDPDLAVAHALRAYARIELARLDAAEADTDAALAHDPDCAQAYQCRAILQELQGHHPQAERNYRRAAGLDPEGFPAPRRLPRHAFDRVVRAALSDLPDVVRERLTNVVVAVRDMPRLEDVRETGLNPLLLGLFDGSGSAERSLSDAWTTLPATITLFQRNLERVCASRGELREQIRTTVLHEVLHFFGLTEEELYERGLD